MPENQESVTTCGGKGGKKYSDAHPETLTLTRKSQVQSITSNVKLRGTAQWKALMKNFSEANKETCKNVPTELPQIHRSLKTFPTGSTYEGTWNLLGMSGEGTYTFPHKGVVYKGGFDDGAFHGEGSLFYECGAIIKGKWNKGKLTERHLFFADGLEYVEHDWAYCRPNDRRFTVEYDNGLEPADQTYKTAEQPTPPIPEGYYDVGDGLYDPITKTVYKYDDLTGIVRSPSDREAKWIEDNCRVNPDLPKGPCPFLYEEWQAPTLELVPEPPPALICSTSPDEEPEPEESTVHRGSAKSRGKLFHSRIGLGSRTEFYNPNKKISTPSPPFLSTVELKANIAIKESVSPKTSELSKMSTTKPSSVGFRIVEPEATETILIKAHKEYSEKNIISEWGLKEKHSDQGEISSNWNDTESQLKPIDKDDTANFEIRDKGASSLDTLHMKQEVYDQQRVEEKSEPTEGFIIQPGYEQNQQAGAEHIETEDISAEGSIVIPDHDENVDAYAQDPRGAYDEYKRNAEAFAQGPDHSTTNQFLVSDDADAFVQGVINKAEFDETIQIVEQEPQPDFHEDIEQPVQDPGTDEV